MIFLCLLFFLHLHGIEHPPKFEGIFGEPTPQIENMTKNVWIYLPYNPVIVEVGGYEGENTKCVAEWYPKGRIIVFEPNPRAFEKLVANLQGEENITPVNAALGTYNGTAELHINYGVYCNDPRQEKWSSLLEGFCFGSDYFNCFKGPAIEVPCVVLDDWCKEHQIAKIDFLHLDTEGYELQILKSSPEILKTVTVIHAKTNLSQVRKGTTQYRELHQFLTDHGFTLYSHWYLEGLQGEATYIQSRIYDALFK